MLCSPKKTLLFLLAVFVSAHGFAQKKVIDHTAYNSWKSLSNASISPFGNYISYEIKPYRGDGFLYWRNSNGKLDSIARGGAAKFAPNETFLTFSITGYYDSLRALQLSGTKKKDLPKDSMGVVLLKKDSLYKIPQVIDFKVAEKADWLAYRLDKNELSTSKKKKANKKKKQTATASEGKLLVISEPTTHKTIEYKDVTNYALSPSAQWVVFSTQQKVKKADSIYLHIVSLNGTTKYQKGSYTEIGDFLFSHDESHLAFLASTDTNKNNKLFNLYLIDLTQNKTTLIDTNYSGISLKNTVSKHGELWFSEQDHFLYFGTAKRPKQEAKDTLLKEEKFVVDIWNWQDNKIQPKQLAELEKEKNRSFLSRINLASGALQILENDTLSIDLNRKVEAKKALVYSSKSYESSYDYTSPWKTDVYVLDLETNRPQLLLKGFANEVSLSPDGSGAVYFNPTKKNYYYQHIGSGKEECLTCRLDENWYTDANGMPMDKEPFPVVGWVKEGKEVLLQSEYDLFVITLDGSKKTRLTIGHGKENREVMRWQNWESDSAYIDLNRAWVTGFNRDTKYTTLYKTYSYYEKATDQLEKIYAAYADVNGIEKAKKGDQIMFRQGNLTEYPELWTATSSFEHAVKISNTNPQQKEYNWANVELVHWKAPSGEKLQGLLYTPENLDQTRKYPMLVYFYELYSDDIHNYYSPKPTASIIYPTEYASAGYVIFIPDIRYTPGHPAQSAYDCIMSGVDNVLRKYHYVDEQNMGIQGQSWGGYQVAQLVTMTTRFKAAMAGAPVSNMFSAYGGIRWNSGMSRQFQYEHTQSRIGGTIWDVPELYVENSPIFGLPKVKTPLLIMSNDDDGAVPWYQGIELFMDLRRLHKPVWLLNYNGDEHNLMKPANRMDLSIRMRQFFDHFLQAAPAPEWLKKGIPATEKGKTTGYATTEDK